MEFALETHLDSPIEVGAGSAILLKGWCYHPDRALRKLEILLEGKAFDVRRHSITRFDVLRDQEPGLTTRGNSLNSGFSVVLPLSPIADVKEAKVEVRATFSGGLVETTPAGTLRLLPTGPAGIPAAAMNSGPGPLVAIILVTNNPDMEVVRRQLESFRAQTHQNWVAIIGDDASDEHYLELLRAEVATDPRLQLFTNTAGQSSEKHFVTTLTRAPVEAEYIAFSEPGDVWSAERLAACVAAFDTDTVMVATNWESDAEDRHEGEQKAAETSLEAALFGRTPPDGSVVFRRSLLDQVLPLPPAMVNSRPEEWISTATLALGAMRFVDKPLYKPARHPSAVSSGPGSLSAGVRGSLAWMDEPMIVRSNPESVMARRAASIGDLERAALWATVLLARGGGGVEKRAVLERWSKMLETPGKLLREASKVGDHAWTSYFALVSERMLSSFTRRQRRDVLDSLRGLWGLYRAENPVPMGHGIEAAKSEVDFIPSKIAPLNLTVSRDHPTRVNIITSTIDFRYLFGGYFAVFSLALKLSRKGLKVRLVLT
ncbi:MAG: hypothetical protein QOJ65_2188, partial [Fimbriimonadaceae bacterium]|nr:hypothetical protein [Fimbriimonadaceae bacterium]